MNTLDELPQSVGKSLPREFLYWLMRALIRINNKLELLSTGTAGNVITYVTGGEIEDSGKAAPTGDFVGTTDTQTLTNKTLTTPTIADFTNSQHDHKDAAGGGELDIFPIGLILLTDDNTNPATLGLSGTWETY